MQWTRRIISKVLSEIPNTGLKTDKGGRVRLLFLVFWINSSDTEKHRTLLEIRCQTNKSIFSWFIGKIFLSLSFSKLDVWTTVRRVTGDVAAMVLLLFENLIIYLFIQIQPQLNKCNKYQCKLEKKKTILSQSPSKI